MKVLTVIGARPQFIKAATVSSSMAINSNIDEVILHTGQHFDENMSDIFFNEMKIPKPKYRLKLGAKSHGAMTGQMMEEIENAILHERPDWLLVYGDTNSTLAGALAASKLNVKVAHVESGLRSFNMSMPEEINRILTDRVSSILFCPTKAAINNLVAEGYGKFNVKMLDVGDVMFEGSIKFGNYASRPLWMNKDEYALCTIHRAENTNDVGRLRSIIEALNTINDQLPVILPIHPRTKEILKHNYIKANFKIVDPVGYFEMLWLIRNSRLILTDSGGLQKEAFFFQKPCITLRDETEWVELVENKYNVLAGSNCGVIVNTFREFQFNSNYDIPLYGDGDSSKKIIAKLLEYK